MRKDFKNIIRHSSIYSLGNILSKLVGFIMIPVYTRFLNTADYGILELLTLTSTLLSMILSVRVSGGMIRYYHEYDSVSDKNRLVSTLLIFASVVAGLAAIVLSMTAEFVSSVVFGTIEYSKYLVFVFISMAFELCVEIAFTYLRVLEKSTHYIAVSLFQLALGLSLNILFIVVLKWGVLAILVSMVVSNGVVCLLLVGYVFRKVKFHFHVHTMSRLLKFTLPIVPAGILMFVLNMGDRFLLNRLGVLSDVGIYALGYKFGMLLGTFIGSPFLSIWIPKRVDIYKNRENRDEIFPRALVYFVFVLSVGGLAISLLIKDVLSLIATAEFLPAHRIVPWIVIGYAFYNLFYVVDIGIFVNDKTFWYPIINGVAAAVNVGLNFLLIPMYGAMGAAIVTAISFLICPLMAFIVSQRLYYIRYDFMRILKLLMAVAILYLLGSILSTENLLLDMLIKCAVILSCPVFLYYINFFDSKEIAFIRKSLTAKLGLSIS